MARVPYKSQNKQRLFPSNNVKPPVFATEWQRVDSERVGFTLFCKPRSPLGTVKVRGVVEK